MKIILLCLFILGSITTMSAKDGFPDEPFYEELEDTRETKSDNTLGVDSSMNITVVGQGIAPSFAISPAQSYVLAKRAALAYAYRLIAERINGVKIEGKDTIKNMAIKSSVINTQVSAMIKNASVVETTFKDGLCEVELEIRINYNNFK